MCPHSSSGEAPFYLIFGWDTYIPLCSNYCYQKSNVFEMKSVGSILMKVDQRPYKMHFKVDMVLLKNHTLTTAFGIKYKTSYQIYKWLSDKHCNIQDNTAKVRCTSIQHLQLLHLTDQVLTQWPDMITFGQTTNILTILNSWPTYM